MGERSPTSPAKARMNATLPDQGGRGVPKHPTQASFANSFGYFTGSDDNLLGLMQEVSIEFLPPCM